LADVDVDIEAMAVSGEGIGRSGGRRVHVPFTIPGERVRARLAPRGDQARLLAVLRPSPHRVAPRCRHFGPDAEPGLGPCGGCSWQHIDYREQLRLKTALVDRLVRAAVPRAPRTQPMLPATAVAEPWGYRQKVHFVFGGGSGLLMGHYVRGTRRVIPVDECPVHDARGNALAFAIHHHFLRRRVQADDGRDGVVSSLAVRVGAARGELMATIVARNDRDRRLRAATRDAMADAPDAAFHLNLHPANSPYIFGPETRRLQGHERLREEVGGASFLVAADAFFQTNVAAAELLVQLVAAAVPPASRVLDLYAGAGLFALPLARAGHVVTAVEENRDAVAAGIAATRLNRLNAARCQFVARRVEDAVRTAAPVDVVVLDPPRAGCRPAVIDRVFGALRPATAVYVSCNPEALATDLTRIAASGYRLRSVQPVDMFPHTPHIEAVAVLTR
jgi:23S rRNA (uracil1939-C5)-methyltransferase